MRFLNNILPYILILFVIGCSTKKNTFLRRSVHSIGTEYNVLYNGNIALTQGKEALVNEYVDNYWDLLPVERLKIDEDVILPGQKEKNPHFARAEEKAAKAIQKHSMNIEGKEYNPQMDEAYLLLGKARYYDQRFVPAMEAFNYVLYKYWTSDKVNETRIWREKVNIRLDNETLALKNLKRMLRLEKLSPREYADAYAAMAQAYINLKYKDSAIQALETAVSYTKDYEEKGRYHYITGQLYDSLQDHTKANEAFNKIIELNRKTLRIYVINAHLEKIRNLSKDSVNDIELLEFMTKLEEDYENNAFLDKIYREKAMFYAERDSMHLMEEYMNKSLRTATTDTYLKAFNYEYLAQYRFDNALYKEAGFYYDSTLTNLEKNTRKYRLTEKKRNTLNDVIKYEDIARETDSILSLTAMSETERKTYFEKYIQELKDEEERKKEEALKRAEALQYGNQQQPPGFKSSFPGSKGKNKALFYFYNPVTLQYGRNEFRKTWGQRKLEDNWRLQDKSIITEEEETAQAQETVSEDKYKVDYYLGKIPSEARIIDSIKTERNQAYYQLGVLYKEKFREYQLAVEKLEQLLDYEPGERLTLGAKYNLYKIFQTVESPKAEAVKEDIIANHPESRYAAILKDPDAVISDDEQTPEVVYTELFRAFEAQDYETVITRAEAYISQFKGDPIAPKFEMLKASATGKLKGFESYKESLNYIALNYPNETEGKEAARIIKEDLKGLELKKFAPATTEGSWKLVFPLQRSDEKRLKKLSKVLSKSLTDLNYDYLSISKDIYNDTRLFLVVHGFESEDRALGYAELLNINRAYRIKDKNFAILSANYKIVQVHKNLETYEEENLKSK